MPWTALVKGSTSGNPSLCRRSKRLPARVPHSNSSLTQALYWVWAGNRTCTKKLTEAQPSFPALFFTLWGFSPACLLPVHKLWWGRERKNQKPETGVESPDAGNTWTNRHTRASWLCRQSPAPPPSINPDTNTPQAGCIWSAQDSLATYAASVQQLQHVLRLLSLPTDYKYVPVFPSGAFRPQEPLFREFTIKQK